MALQTLRANFSDVLALHITQKTLAKYQVIHAETFEKKEIYDRIHMAVTETPNRCALYIDMICGVTKAVVSLTGVIAILASFDVRIVFATCCLTIPLLKIKNKISIKNMVFIVNKPRAIACAILSVCHFVECSQYSGAQSHERWELYCKMKSAQPYNNKTGTTVQSEPGL